MQHEAEAQKLKYGGKLQRKRKRGLSLKPFKNPALTSYHKSKQLNALKKYKSDLKLASLNCNCPYSEVREEQFDQEAER